MIYYILLIPFASFLFTKRIKNLLDAKKNQNKEIVKIECILLLLMAVVLIGLIFIIESIRN